MSTDIEVDELNFHYGVQLVFHMLELLELLLPVEYYICLNKDVELIALIVVSNHRTR